MCYRYSIYSKPELLEVKFHAKFTEKFTGKYHVSAFSQQKLPVIINEAPVEISLFQWGLIPFWVKNEQQAQEIQRKTANARGETIYEKPMFRQSAHKRHCLVLTDGFFEWREVNGFKYPYYVRLKSQEPFAFAGLWDTWMNPTTQEEIQTFTIITTEANPLMATVHNQKKRMPVMLSDDAAALWIDTKVSSEEAKTVLVPFDETKMEAYTISKLITARGRDPDVAEVLQPFQYPGIEPQLG